MLNVIVYLKQSLTSNLYLNDIILKYKTNYYYNVTICC